MAIQRIRKDFAVMVGFVAIAAVLIPSDPFFPDPGYRWTFLLTGLAGSGAVLKVAKWFGAYRSDERRSTLSGNYGAGPLMQGLQILVLLAVTLVSAIVSRADEAMVPMYLLFIGLVFAANIIVLGFSLGAEESASAADDRTVPLPTPKPAAESALTLLVFLSIFMAIFGQIQPAPGFDTTYLTVMACGALSQLAALLVVVRYGGKKLTMTALVAVLASWLAIALPMARLIGHAMG